MKFATHIGPARAAQFIAGLSAFLFITLRAGAIIDAPFQMQLGNPSNAIADTNNHSHYLIQRPVEAIDYNEALGLPNWVSWDLTAGDLGSSERSPDFFTDTNLPPNFYWVTHGDYTGSGFDRGHLCPSADRTDSELHNDMVFYMSNIIPQASDNNQGVWASFEGYCRSLAQSGDELLIICGPSGFDGSRIQPSGKVAIPAYTWKIAVVVPPGSGTALSRITETTRVISLKIPNSNGISALWQNYVTSASQIEVDTGFAFFSALSPSVAAALRNKVDGQTSPAPVVLSFSPMSGAAYANVVIVGTNFSFASAVTFNGVNAAFTVDSATQITASVPLPASSGPISVTTPGGTALSSNIFTAVGSTDLTIRSSHAGNFAQGDEGRVYTIVVTNAGTLTSTGEVLVADFLPAGLTATEISGAGWTPDLNTLTASRSDSLAPGASFPAISIVVNVSPGAPVVVTNTATVSGGGDVNPANNTSGDATVIDPSGGGGGTITLAGWDVHNLAGGANNFGISPLVPTTNSPRLSIVGLTRGSGIGTSGTAAARAWGGNTFTSSSAAAAIAANQFTTFRVTANAGYAVSFAAIGPFDYRHSPTGPVNGLLQYQIGSGPFTDVAILSYPSNTSSGASLNTIDLSGIAALQNVPPGTNVVFRIANWGGTSSAGTWYIFDVANSPAPDLVVQGDVTPLAPIQLWKLQWFGTIANTGTAADGAITASDGLPNLVKYALGLNPFVAATNSITADLSTGHLRLTVPKNPNATDVTFHVEGTDHELTEWTTNGLTVDQNSATVLQVHANAPATSENFFMRVRVSRP